MKNTRTLALKTAWIVFLPSAILFVILLAFRVLPRFTPTMTKMPAFMTEALTKAKVEFLMGLPSWMWFVATPLLAFTVRYYIELVKTDKDKKELYVGTIGGIIFGTIGGIIFGTIFGTIGVFKYLVIVKGLGIFGVIGALGFGFGFLLIQMSLISTLPMAIALVETIFQKSFWGRIGFGKDQRRVATDTKTA